MINDNHAGHSVGNVALRRSPGTRPQSGAIRNSVHNPAGTATCSLLVILMRRESRARLHYEDAPPRRQASRRAALARQRGSSASLPFAGVDAGFGRDTS